MGGLRVGVLAPMKPELLPVVKLMSLRRDRLGDVDVSVGRVGAADVTATMTGIGMEPAALATARLLDATALDHVMVVGIAGGIVPHVRLGDLLVPEIVVDARTGREYRQSPLDGGPVRGRIESSDDLLVDKDEIARRAERGVFALDMETGAVAAVCAERGVSWSAYRAISDLAGDSAIDPDIMKLSGPDGSGNAGALVRYLARNPMRVAGLARLTKGMRAATASAAAAARRAIEGARVA